MDSNNFILQTGMDVFGSDGEKVGSIDAIEDNYFIVRKGFFFPEDHYIPFSAVNTYEENTVYLNVTKDGALEQEWGQQPVDEYADPLIGTTGTGFGETQVTDPAYGETDFDDPTHIDRNSGSYEQTDTDSGAATLEVREEDLQATTREVDRGTVRIDKHVIEEEQSIDVPLTEEEVHVERRAVNRPAGNVDFEDTTIEVPVRGEEVEVSKTGRVVEEIDVDKIARERVETVSDTVRHEEVDVNTEDVHSSLNRTNQDSDRSLIDKAKDALDPDDEEGIR